MQERFIVFIIFNKKIYIYRRSDMESPYTDIAIVIGVINVNTRRPLKISANYATLIFREEESRYVAYVVI